MFHPDGLVEIRSPRLAEKLQAAGCRPLGHRNGHAIFGKTGTVKYLIQEYAASYPAGTLARQARRRELRSNQPKP